MTRGELTALLRRLLEDAADSTSPAERPIVIGMSGAQGSGKTTSAAKLAKHIVKLGRAPLLVAADPYRPAAADRGVRRRRRRATASNPR